MISEESCIWIFSFMIILLFSLRSSLISPSLLRDSGGGSYFYFKSPNLVLSVKWAISAKKITITNIILLPTIKPQLSTLF